MADERWVMVLDGLQDPTLARSISARLSGAGIDNRLDLTAQRLHVEAEDDDPRIAGILAAFGMAVGTEGPDVWRCRLGRAAAVLLVLALLSGAVELAIAVNTVTDTWRWLHAALLLPALYYADPIICQSLAAMRALRSSADLLTGAIVFIAALLAVGDLAGWGVAEAGKAALPLAIGALALGMVQRWLSHRMAERLSGRADSVIAGWHRLVAVWLAASLLLGLLAGWPWLMALLLVLPPMLSLGAVNPWSPRWQMALGPIAFALVLAGPAGALSTPGVAPWPQPLPPILPGVVGLGFQAIMVVVMAMGWRSIQPLDNEQAPAD